MDTSSTKPPKTHKVRDSCNACSAHKIRCGKERPQCTRCASKGLNCQYSVSKRTGQRLPWISPPNFLGLEDTQSATQQQTDQNKPSVFTETMDVTATFAQFDVPSLASPTPSDDLQQIFSIQSNQPYQVNLPNSDTATESVFDGSMDWDDSASMIGKAPRVALSRRQPMLDHNEYFGSDLSSIDLPCRPPIYRRATLPESMIASPLQGDAQNRAHSCVVTILQVVADLTVVDQGCLTASENADDEGLHLLENETCDPAAILERNLLAAQRLNKILSCPCAVEGDVLIAIYLALHKIVSWYGAIVGMTDGARNTLPGRISNGPIYMGSFCLDAQAHLVVRAQIVLTQLQRNVGPLIKKLDYRAKSLRSQGSSPHSDDTNGSPAVADVDINLVECYHRAILERIERIVASAGTIKQS